MARTKHGQDREAKRDEIVAAARALFVEAGYEASSMSRLAAAAGVAPNTIYWYFRDKDEVLVAVLDAEFSARMAEYLLLPPGDAAERLLWVAQQLQRVHGLVATVHSRLEQSPALSDWHARFHQLSEQALRLDLQRAGVPAAQVEARVKISVFALEGLLAHPLPEAEQRAICAALVAA